MHLSAVGIYSELKSIVGDGTGFRGKQEKALSATR
jgi:hypothetical protein